MTDISHQKEVRSEKMQSLYSVVQSSKGMPNENQRKFNHVNSESFNYDGIQPSRNNGAQPFAEHDLENENNKATDHPSNHSIYQDYPSNDVVRAPQGSSGQGASNSSNSSTSTSSFNVINERATDGNQRLAASAAYARERSLANQYIVEPLEDPPKIPSSQV